MTLLLTIASLMSAHAGSLSAAVGTSTAFDGDPASMRLSLRAETNPTPGPVSASFVMPVTIGTQGNESFGISTSQTQIELPPSLRVRLFSDGFVRPYGDAGAGIAVATSRSDGWLFEDHDSFAAFMTRSALGLEVGASDGLSMLIEPVSVSTYHEDRIVSASYGLMLGVSGAL